MKKVIVIGAGPAGLTAAYELSKQKEDYDVVVYEESNTFGGISRTVNYKGNRMDMGGHRFFSKVDAVNKWWEETFLVSFSVSDKYILLQRTNLKGNAFRQTFPQT